MWGPSGTYQQLFAVLKEIQWESWAIVLTWWIVWGFEIENQSEILEKKQSISINFYHENSNRDFPLICYSSRKSKIYIGLWKENIENTWILF